MGIEQFHSCGDSMHNLAKAELSPIKADKQARAGASTAMPVGGSSPRDIAPEAVNAGDGRGLKVRAMLKARLGDENYSSWFATIGFEHNDGRVLKISVPTTFLRSWISSHYLDVLLECCRAEFSGIEKIDLVVRQPGIANTRPVIVPTEAPQRESSSDARGSHAPSQGLRPLAGTALPAGHGRTQVGGFEGSPLDPRYTFDSFVIGTSNRIAHAGAVQVAETITSESPSFNPLYIHSSVGLGKTHLLHAIAWEVKRRAPNAQVLYLTAERFRYQFVEALRSQDPASFKEKFRSIHMLLIDDLEFMQGERTEQEFDHIINALLDGGRQVVVASARAPSHIERLNDRMRSRLQRGLVAEISPLDDELRAKVLAKRVAEKRVNDPSFELPKDVSDLLINRLTESGRELEGAVNRLYATWQCMRSPLTLDIAETVIRDLVQGGMEPRRIKIEDILRIISRHYGVSKGDLLSQRRHRSVVWPRQIGMYLAKQLTHRSLPEIGRRFGGRDHTTVLHAIRKIDGLLSGDTRLRDELEELKKLLSH